MRAGLTRRLAVAAAAGVVLCGAAWWTTARAGGQTGEGEPRLALPGTIPGATVRTFDTPEFRGMTFYEVRAKSIINRVPASSPSPGTDWPAG